MSYILYYSRGSSNLVIRMLLEDLGARYTDIEVPSRTVHRDPDFMRLNPRGLVPVLVDQDHAITLFETGAIALYLADKHRRLAPPTDDLQHRAEFLKWLFLLSNTVHADLNARFYFERYVGALKPDDAFFSINRSRILAHLDVLDGSFGEDARDSFLEWGLSVCDYYLGCLVRWAQIYPIGNPALLASDLPRFGNLFRVLGALQMQPLVQRAFAREGITGQAFLHPIHPRS